jgi:hypothetical protein
MQSRKSKNKPGVAAEAPGSRAEPVAAPDAPQSRAAGELTRYPQLDSE